MPTPRVALAGALDTKGEEYGYLRDQIRAQGCDTCVIDCGVLGTPSITVDVARDAVARAAGVSISELERANNRGAAIDAMARGVSAIVARMHRDGEIHGIAALGGSGGATLVAQAMQGLPVGVPKLLVSTIASGNTRPYVGASDLTLMYSIVDIAGVNRVSSAILANAAAAIAGMATQYAGRVASDSVKPLIAATMFGVTTPCVTVAKQILSDRGFEVLVFHATGVGGDSMESLIRSGFFAGVLDVTTTELADYLVGGVCAAGPTRLEAAGSLGVPQVVSLGALDMVNFGPLDTVPEKFRRRRLYKHNANVTLMRTSEEECAELGMLLADKLNHSLGPVSVFVPLRGVSMISTADGVFADSAADAALVRSLRSRLSDKAELYLEDMEINDERFARAMAERLLRHLEDRTSLTGVSR